MDWQHIINLGGGALLSVLGWFARQLWDAVKRLQSDLNRLELSISDNYVKKSDLAVLKAEMGTRFDRIEQLLDKVYDKLDNKADR
jgi:hypothetical protein